MELIWEDPKEEPTDRGHTKYGPVKEALQANPNKWALLSEMATPHDLAKYRSAFTRAKGYKMHQERNLGPDEFGWKVYVKYIKEN